MQSSWGCTTEVSVDVNGECGVEFVLVIGPECMKVCFEKIIGVIPVGNAQLILTQSNGLLANLLRDEVKRVGTSFEVLVACKENPVWKTWPRRSLQSAPLEQTHPVSHMTTIS